MSNRKLNDLMKLMMAGVYAIEVEEETSKSAGTVSFRVSNFKGPSGTPYEGGVFAVGVLLPADYPFKSPSIGFRTRIFHPNIDERSGSVCLDVINQAWSPIFDLKNIFDQFLPQLLTYGNAADPLNGEAAALMLREPEKFKSKVKEYVAKYASASVSTTTTTTSSSSAAAASSTTSSSSTSEKSLVPSTRDEKRGGGGSSVVGAGAGTGSDENGRGRISANDAVLLKGDRVGNETTLAMSASYDNHNDDDKEVVNKKKPLASEGNGSSNLDTREDVGGGGYGQQEEGAREDHGDNDDEDEDGVEGAGSDVSDLSTL